MYNKYKKVLIDTKNVNGNILILSHSNGIPILVFKTILVLPLCNVGSTDDGILSNYEDNILIFRQFFQGEHSYLIRDYS